MAMEAVSSLTCMNAIAYTSNSLPFQVQSCSNTAKFTIQRLGGTPVPVFDDTEATFPELKARIDRTIEVLKTADPASMDGLESKELLMETKMGTFRFETGQRYVSEYAMANFHFHLSTAYCILRHRGVPLGAFDYMKDVFEKV